MEVCASGWGWLARFGDIEGTFRTRDVCMLAYANVTESPRGGDPSGHERRGDGERQGGGGRVFIGGAEEGEGQPAVLSARTPRGKDVGGDLLTPRSIIKNSEPGMQRPEEAKGAKDALSDGNTDDKVIALLCTTLC
jgi:hypothetical protein